jgi:hypothetical protein
MLVVIYSKLQILPIIYLATWVSLFSVSLLQLVSAKTKPLLLPVHSEQRTADNGFLKILLLNGHEAVNSCFSNPIGVAPYREGRGDRFRDITNAFSPHLHLVETPSTITQRVHGHRTAVGGSSTCYWRWPSYGDRNNYLMSTKQLEQIFRSRQLLTYSRISCNQKCLYSVH